MALQLLIQIGSEWYGLALDALQEVVHEPNRHFVPGSGGILLGAINLRGQVLPVIDLPLLFESRETHRDPRLVVLTADYHQLALQVSDVGRIVPAAPPETAEPREDCPVPDPSAIQPLDPTLLIARVEQMLTRQIARKPEEKLDAFANHDC